MKTYDKKDIKSDYLFLLSTVNEQNWKFPQLILGLSVGILAFSIQSTEVKLLEEPLILFISWFFFFWTFIFSFGRILNIQKGISRDYFNKGNEYYSNDESENDNSDNDNSDNDNIDGWYNKRIIKTSYGKFFYGAMMICLGLGVIFFVVHKIIENWKFFSC